MIKLQIDGQTIQVPQGSTIIEAADQAGIYIPRFCYHKKLSVAANCRMCLVDVDKSKKSLAACATPATDGMIVHTQSEEALKSQRYVMEFLLVNHPLDCPVCDQGGECELQDLAVGYGQGYSQYDHDKRAVLDEDLGPLIATEMTRCILCTRCVRFGEEIAGLPELGVTERSNKSQIGTYAKHFMHSELSGNVIDLCPVGALTSKPFQFSARGWEMRSHDSIASHDCLGSHVSIHTRQKDNLDEREVMRVVPRECERLNENWLSDRDRFSYQAWQSDYRLLEPKMKVDGQWQVVDWETLMTQLQNRLLGIVNKGCKVAGAISPSATVEEAFLFQQLIRGLGGHQVDYRLQQSDRRDPNWPLQPTLALDFESVERLQHCLLVGSNMSLQQPLLAHRLRTAVEDGCQVHSIEVYQYHYHFKTASRELVSGLDLLTPCARLLAALLSIKDDQLIRESLSSILLDYNQSDIDLAQMLLQSGNQRAIFIGEDAINHPSFSSIHVVMLAIAKLTGVSLSYLSTGSNAAGVALAGCTPGHQAGGVPVDPLPSGDLWLDGAGAYFLLGVEPERDCVDAYRAMAALSQTQCVVAMTPYPNALMLEYADFILPITPMCETAGTYVNALGDWQSFLPASLPRGQSKPAWKVLRVIAHFLKVSGCNYEAIDQVLEACRDCCQSTSEQVVQWQLPNSIVNKPVNHLKRYGAWPSYSIDSTLRHAVSLQAKQGAQIPAGIALSPDTAADLGIKGGQIVTVQQDQCQLDTRCYINPLVAPGTAHLPSGCVTAEGFGHGFSDIQIIKKD